MSAPFRILVTTDAVGGVWTYALDLAAALGPDFSIALAILGPPPVPEQIQAARDVGANLHLTDLPLDWTADSAAELEHVSTVLAALAWWLKVDCVQLHTPALMGQAKWATPVLAVLHSCLGTWWRAMHGSAPPPEDFL